MVAIEPPTTKPKPTLQSGKKVAIRIRRPHNGLLTKAGCMKRKKNLSTFFDHLIVLEDSCGLCKAIVCQMSILDTDTAIILQVVHTSKWVIENDYLAYSSEENIEVVRNKPF